MNADIKAEWLRRLDTYEQGQHLLKSNKKFCCLGVLCDIAVDAGIGHWENDILYIGDDQHTQLLPSEVVLWAGLLSDNPMVKLDDGIVTTLTYLNDVTRYTFAEIKQLIETQL